MNLLLRHNYRKLDCNQNSKESVKVLDNTGRSGNVPWGGFIDFEIAQVRKKNGTGKFCRLFCSGWKESDNEINWRYLPTGYKYVVALWMDRKVYAVLQEQMIIIVE